MCIPPPSPDLDCADIEYRNFVVCSQTHIVGSFIRQAEQIDPFTWLDAEYFFAVINADTTNAGFVLKISCLEVPGTH